MFSGVYGKKVNNPCLVAADYINVSPSFIFFFQVNIFLFFGMIACDIYLEHLFV